MFHRLRHITVDISLYHSLTQKKANRRRKLTITPDTDSNLANCCQSGYVALKNNLKKKVISASVYLAAAVAMGVYYDAVQGAGSVTCHALLLRVGVAGAFLFGCTSLLSLWKPHRAVFVGILACCLCWSYFVRIIPRIPFLQSVSVMGYAYWNETLLALLILTLASAYSLRQSWQTFSYPNS